MDFKELYQQVIIDHSKQPRNRREMTDATGKVEGYNPLCGDRITCYIKYEDDVVEALAGEIAENSPGTNRIDKALLRDAARMGRREALLQEREMPYGMPEDMAERMRQLRAELLRKRALSHGECNPYAQKESRTSLARMALLGASTANSSEDTSVRMNIPAM